MEDSWCGGHCGACDTKHSRIEAQAKQEVLEHLRMYMSVAEVKNPLIMIDEYMAKYL